MSFEALNWAQQVQTGGPGTKCLLLVLAAYADENQSCFPGQERLATATEQGVRTIQRQIKELERLGLIQIETRGLRGGGRTSNRYTLLVGSKPANLAANPPSEGQANPPSATGKPATDDKQTRHLRQANPPRVADKQPEEQPVEQPVEQPDTWSSADDRALPTSGGIPLTEDVMDAMVQDAEDGHEDALFVVQATKPRPTRTSAAVDRILDEEFDGTFWPLYPRKVGKEKARLDFRRARRKGVTLDVVMAGLRRFVQEKADTEARFICHASTWLNAGRWADEPDRPSQATSGRSNGHRPYQNDDYWSTP